MDAFQPMINLFVLLTILSIAAERVANLIKLKDPDLRVEKEDEAAEKKREQEITARAIAVSVFIALLVKANFFEILANLEAPWSTLGWVKVQSGEWIRTYALTSWGTALYTAAGCVVTGVAMGFGSKFWHDILDMVYELRSVAKKKAEG